MKMQEKHDEEETEIQRLKSRLQEMSGGSCTKSEKMEKCSSTNASPAKETSGSGEKDDNKVKCRTKRCHCRKHNMFCTDGCKCVDYEYMELHAPESTTTELSAGMTALNTTSYKY
ncbi:hypothetical protein DPMN_038074 [Dreissena polymorpha]|uniref:Tesmin/TSO1-like CXC domain-containing protein n=1 Tax=Dreissena polymorpha TaxID=45954 RepID=A0A9D4MEK2_DREPO|nr:hypothetical protein DPMN_038074 [Dreissena polymorpha]